MEVSRTNWPLPRPQLNRNAWSRETWRPPAIHWPNWEYFDYSPATAARGLWLNDQYHLGIPWWLVFLLSGLPLLPLRRCGRNAIRVSKGLCPTCGYDLRATPERCPECGTAISASASPPPHAT